MTNVIMILLLKYKNLNIKLFIGQRLKGIQDFIFVGNKFATFLCYQKKKS